jgi:hypothetical protein
MRPGNSESPHMRSVHAGASSTAFDLNQCAGLLIRIPIGPPQENASQENASGCIDQFCENLPVKLTSIDNDMQRRALSRILRRGGKCQRGIKPSELQQTYRADCQSVDATPSRRARSGWRGWRSLGKSLSPTGGRLKIRLCC